MCLTCLERVKTEIASQLAAREVRGDHEGGAHRPPTGTRREEQGGGRDAGRRGGAEGRRGESCAGPAPLFKSFKRSETLQISSNFARIFGSFDLTLLPGMVSRADKHCSARSRRCLSFRFVPGALLSAFVPAERAGGEEARLFFRGCRRGEGGGGQTGGRGQRNEGGRRGRPRRGPFDYQLHLPDDNVSR